MSLSASGPYWKLRIDLEHDVVLVERGEDRRDDALAEGVVERVVDRRRQDAEARRGIAIDRDVEQRSGILLVAGDVGDAAGALFSLSRKIAAQWLSSFGSASVSVY